MYNMNIIPLGLDRNPIPWPPFGLLAPFRWSPRGDPPPPSLQGTSYKPRNFWSCAPNLCDHSNAHWSDPSWLWGLHLGRPFEPHTILYSEKNPVDGILKGCIHSKEGRWVWRWFVLPFVLPILLLFLVRLLLELRNLICGAFYMKNEHIETRKINESNCP